MSLTRPHSRKKIHECELTYKIKMSSDVAKQEGEVKSGRTVRKDVEFLF